MVPELELEMDLTKDYRKDLRMGLELDPHHLQGDRHGYQCTGMFHQPQI